MLAPGERRAERLAAADVVALQVADAAVDDALRGVQAMRLEPLGQPVRQEHLADQSALPGHRVDHAVPAGELHAFGGGTGQVRPVAAVVGRLFLGTAEGEQLVGADPRRVCDLGGERVAGILPGGDGADLRRRVGARLRAVGLCGLDHRQRGARRQLHGDGDHHGLDRLALHVEGLLPHLGGAAFQVRDGALRRQRGQRHVERPGDLRQALLVVPRGADRSDATALQPLDDARGLFLRIAGPRAEPVTRLVAAAAGSVTPGHWRAS